MTAPSEFETTPLMGDLSWLTAYARARASMRWSTHTFDDTPGLRTSPQWVRRVYDGMRLAEPEPEPEPSRWQRLRQRF